MTPPIDQDAHEFAASVRERYQPAEIEMLITWLERAGPAAISAELRRTALTSLTAQGHRRDPLAGLNAALQATLEDASAEPLSQTHDCGPWRAGIRGRPHDGKTIAAAARRGLLRLQCGEQGRTARYVLTASGRTCAEEIRRRAKVRTAPAVPSPLHGRGGSRRQGEGSDVRDPARPAARTSP